MNRTRTIRLAALIAIPMVVSAACAAHAEKKARALTEQEMTDIMVGASVQASRSANSEPMIKAVKQAMAEGKRFTMIAPEDVPDTWTVVLPSGIGGGGAWEYVRDRAKQQNLAAAPDSALKAIKALESHLGKKFDAVMR